MLKAVLFDLDETLIDRGATMRAAAKDQYCRFFSPDAAVSEADYVAKFIELDAGGKSSKQESLEALRAHFGLEPGWKELLADRDAAAIRHATLRAGAVACLERVKKAGLAMAVVTNGRYPFQYDKAVGAGIAGYFGAFVVSEAEGFEKPDARIFAVALAKLGVAPDEAMFVGDDPERDVRGAQGVGMQAIFVASADFPVCDEADLSVKSLNEVFPRKKDVLEGKTLEAIVTELVEKLGWEALGDQVAINCFLNDPSVASSLKFLRRTPWARAKVESLYRTINS